jgi:hypothetical protein
MKFTHGLLVAGVLGLAFAVPAGKAEAAVVGPVAAKGSIDLKIAKPGVEQVQYRRRYHRHRGRGYGRGVAVGVGAAIVGGILLSEAARAESRRTRRDAWDRCADTFRSFDPESGTYVNSNGQRRVCPYLR